MMRHRVNGQVVVEHASGLMWQQGGSEKRIPPKTAKAYIKELNEKKFAGFNDWRLPSLEEAMSLVEPQKNGVLYIDPVFDKTRGTSRTIAAKVTIPTSAQMVEIFRCCA